VAPDGKLMAVEIKPGRDFEHGLPRELFELPDIDESAREPNNIISFTTVVASGINHSLLIS
jgi:hypothetical protein